jgi:hypothetical protein
MASSEATLFQRSCAWVDVRMLAPVVQFSGPATPSPERIGELTMLLILLVVFLFLSLGGGGWGHSRYGYASWSPAGMILFVLLIMWFTGHLHA